MRVIVFSLSEEALEKKLRRQERLEAMNGLAGIEKLMCGARLAPSPCPRIGCPATLLAAYRGSTRRRQLILLVAFWGWVFLPVVHASPPVIPGTGTKMVEVGDDFEDQGWEYFYNNPKSTRDLDGNERPPGGESANGRWYEGVKRGHPDVVKRIPTPPGGLPSSHGSLLLQSLQTGIPGRPSGRMQQDDFIADVNYRLGGPISASRSPNVIVRVFFPPVDAWENRTGPQFAFRLALQTTVTKQHNTLFFSSQRAEQETYWVGMFVDFDSKTDGGQFDYATMRIRADSHGNDFTGKQITTTGWWTLGMSVTPDGAVHFFASPGVDDLTPDDHLSSQFPYGYRCEGLKTFFFNVCNGDDGRTWSTAWTIDDPSVYVVR